ncbi:MAG TPA: zinc ABC transporter substrate-binding protein [Sporichthyaceae bacterium]|jgi:zinc/manganese transport system substrate-binding protein|nr:zinc ABC transporter substrate-binding protein [Sporichthyaceae bacterium]
MNVSSKAAISAAVVLAGSTAVTGCAAQTGAQSGSSTPASSAPSAVALAAAAGAATSASTGPSGGKFTVVAAENFWGSIASQLGGRQVTVTSIITNPDTDPHEYEATPDDARLIAGTRMFIQNGIGYDTSWAPKLVAANASDSREVLTVGDVVGLKDGDNPHQWYSRDSVYKVINAIVADYQKIDPADANWFDSQKQTFENQTLAKYNSLESDIKAKYAGTPIGASESIVSPLADTLGLQMLTPYSFLTDISEGTDPTVADKALIDQQIKGKQMKVYVYNSQNSTPDITAQVDEAKKAGIPITTVTETLSPAGASFQEWMVAELESLQDALSLAAGTGQAAQVHDDAPAAGSGSGCGSAR